MNAKQAGIDAQSTANDALSLGNSNATAITAIAIVLGFNSVGLLLTAVGSGVAYTTLGATVAGLTTTVGVHTANIVDINRAIRYMSTSTLFETDYTKFTSDIKIQDISSYTPTIFLSHKDDEPSIFYNDVNINGIITNIELNNNTLNLTSISSRVSTI